MTLTSDQAWETFRAFAKNCPKDNWTLFRKEASAFIHHDRPGLEELGSNDLNCYAVSYLEGGDLTFTADGGSISPGWQWRHRGWKGHKHEPRCECGRLKIFCQSGKQNSLPHADDYGKENIG